MRRWQILRCRSPSFAEGSSRSASIRVSFSWRGIRDWGTVAKVVEVVVDFRRGVVAPSSEVKAICHPALVAKRASVGLLHLKSAVGGFAGVIPVEPTRPRGPPCNYVHHQFSFHKQKCPVFWVDRKTPLIVAADHDTTVWHSPRPRYLWLPLNLALHSAACRRYGRRARDRVVLSPLRVTANAAAPYSCSRITGKRATRLNGARVVGLTWVVEVLTHADGVTVRKLRVS